MDAPLRSAAFDVEESGSFGGRAFPWSLGLQWWQGGICNSYFKSKKGLELGQ
jgi:hypothetical protein